MAVKTVLKISAYVTAFVISSIIILAYLIDANTFKPRIQALAAEHGIALTMRGDLHWAYWPAIGLAVNEVSVADLAAPQKIIADVKKASFLIAFIPLMKGDFQVKHILVDGAVINLDVNAEGIGNWESFLKKASRIEVNDGSGEVPSSATSHPVKNSTTNDALSGPEATAPNDLNLSIEKISLHNSQITYTDSNKGHSFVFKNINVDMDDVNVKGAPFEVTLAWETQFNKINLAQSSAPTNTKIFPVIVKSKLRSKVSIGDGFNSLVFDSGELALNLHMQGSANVNLTFSLNLSDLKNNMHYQGKLAVPTFNAKQLIAAFGIQHKTANDKALTEVGFATEFNGDKNQISLSSLNMQLDKTQLAGNFAVQDFSSQVLAVDLQGGDINIDDYLAPESSMSLSSTPLSSGALSSSALSSIAQASVSSTSIASASKSTATTPINTVKATSVASEVGDEPLLPLPFLRNLNVEGSIAFKSIIFSQLHLEKVLVGISAKQGLTQENINANLYGGSLHVNNKLDARGDIPTIKFDAIIKDIQLAPLLKDKKLNKKINLVGGIEANAIGQTNGITKNQLFNALTSTINFSGAQLRLAPLNVEQQFCKLVNKIAQKDVPDVAWNSYTELKKVVGKVTIAKRIITVDNMSANVEKLLLGTHGFLNLTNGSYDFVLPLKINRDANDTPNSITTSLQGCKVTSNYWVERSMTLLRCQGAYAQMNPAQDCRPDKELLNGLAKDYAAYKLKEKYGEKVDTKKAELIKKLDEKLGGEGNAEKAKELLKNLFKKKHDN